MIMRYYVECRIMINEFIKLYLEQLMVSCGCKEMFGMVKENVWDVIIFQVRSNYYAKISYIFVVILYEYVLLYFDLFEYSKNGLFVGQIYVFNKFGFNFFFLKK